MIWHSWRATITCSWDEPGFIIKETKSTDGKMRRCVLYVPREHNGSRRLPLIIFLHGFGGTGDDGRLQLKTGLATEVWSRHRAGQTFPYFVLFPQASHSWLEGPTDSHAILGLLEKVQSEYPIDTKRLYLTAISDGAIVLWDLAAKYPDRWAALIPISSVADRVKIERVKNIPIRWYQNSSDSIERIRTTVAMLKTSGASIDLVEYDDLTYDAWTRAYADAALYAWLDRNRRHIVSN